MGDKKCDWSARRHWVASSIGRTVMPWIVGLTKCIPFSDRLQKI